MQQIERSRARSSRSECGMVCIFGQRKPEFEGGDAMKEQKFDGHLTARGPKGAWTYMLIPFDVQEAFGRRSRVAVAGTMNGFPFRNSLMPEGDGRHSMTVSKELMAGAGAKAGEMVKVTMKVDDAPRVVEVAGELEAALKSDGKAAEMFEALAYSHKKAYVDWIAGAKRAETRTARAAKAVEMLRAGKRLG